MNAALKGKTVNKVVLLDVGLIKPNPSQPRIIFSQSEIESLANSIIANGLLQPLTVRRCGDHFELISGERRLRATKHAKIPLVPCIVVNTTDRQSAVFALLENLQREDLNYFEEAMAIKNLIVEWGSSQQELGERLGKSQSTIANKLRLLKFDIDTQKHILNSNLNERQARALLKIVEDNALIPAIQYIESKQLNVAQTEKYIESILTGESKSKKKSHLIVKDIRIFFNTINNAIAIMNQSGIQAVTQKKENEEFIEYTVRIPMKGNSKS